MKRRYWMVLSVALLGIGLLAGCQSSTGNGSRVDDTTDSAETENDLSDSAEEEAVSNPTSVESLNLEDGTYTVDVTMEGGSGRATIESPAELIVADGVCTATIIWSSPYYDYMLIGEEKYLPVNTEGNSSFEIPVEIFDGPMEVIADTTAMSEPHEIDYTFQFDSTSLQKQ